MSTLRIGDVVQCRTGERKWVIYKRHIDYPERRICSNNMWSLEKCKLIDFEEEPSEINSHVRLDAINIHTGFLISGFEMEQGFHLDLSFQFAEFVIRKYETCQRKEELKQEKKRLTERLVHIDNEIHLLEY